jgi:hypothetical protein
MQYLLGHNKTIQYHYMIVDAWLRFNIVTENVARPTLGHSAYIPSISIVSLYYLILPHYYYPILPSNYSSMKIHFIIFYNVLKFVLM